MQFVRLASVFVVVSALAGTAFGQKADPASSSGNRKPAKSPTKAAPRIPAANAPVYGKYGCTSSTYSGGFVEYTPRGSFVITKDGKYTYYGLEKPSTGRYTVDGAGNLLFKGGYFDGGKAEKIDRPNKFFLTFPANADHRWTCGLVDKK